MQHVEYIHIYMLMKFILGKVRLTVIKLNNSNIYLSLTLFEPAGVWLG